MDYTFLRETGIKYIQKVASESWTDHNAHDPGITILEALCYAITELGYRANHPIEDLLANDGKPLIGKYQPFFPAEDILPNAPISIEDFRRIVIDQKGVRNCWIEKAVENEQPIFWKAPENKSGPESETEAETVPHQWISYDWSDENRILLRGLYEVLLEFDDDKLNSFEVEQQFMFSVKDSQHQLNTMVIFPHWEEADLLWEEPFFLPEVEVTKVDIVVDRNDDENQTLVGFSLNVYFEILEGVVQRIPVKINAIGENDLTSDLLQDMLIEQMTDQLLLQLTRWIPDYLERIVQSKFTTDKVLKTLHQNRNLCEDFVKIRSARTQHIAVSAKIEVKPNTNVNELLGQIYDRFDEYLDPQIQSQGLEQLMDESSGMEEIFQGPLLENGFISDEEFENVQDRSVIYSSDLISLIMGIDGVVGVRDLSFSNFIGHQIINGDVTDHLVLDTSLYKPRFSAQYSKVSFLDEDVQVESAKKHFHDLRSERRKRLVANGDVSVFLGESKEVQQYNTVQQDFPKTYHIGAEGISDSASDLRKSQVKQLKGYLLVFDQLLADYLSQLARVKDLFSLDPNQDQTYFSQPLYDVPHVSNLLTGFVQGLSNEADVEETWEAFKNDPDNEYITLLKSLVENESTFVRRRNSVLDHLLARFGEDFSDLEQLMLLHNQDDMHTLISDKLDFLNHCPVLSRDRSTAFDYKKRDQNGYPDVWENENISGFEKRIYAKLGLENYQKRHFYSRKLIDKYVDVYQEIDTDNIDEYRFRLKNEQSEILLSSTQHFLEVDMLHDELDRAIRSGFFSYNYRCECAQDGRFYFNLLDCTGDIVGRRIEYFDTPEEVHVEIEKTIDFIRSHFARERLYVVEHLLLRPKINEVISSNSLLERVSYFDRERIDFSFRLIEDLPLNEISLEDYYRISKTSKTKGIAKKKGLVTQSVDQYSFEIGNGNSGTDFTKWLVSSKHDDTYELRNRLVLSARYLTDKRRYRNYQTDTGKYRFKLVDVSEEVLASSAQGFDTSEELEVRINEIISHFKELKSKERLVSDELMPPHFTSNEKLQDPYSFKTSIILPLDEGRFSNPAFRSLTEKKILEEIPAHILPEIFWVYPPAFERFEKVYRHWLLLNAMDEPTNTALHEHYAYDLSTAHRKLLEVLNEIQRNFGIGTSGMTITPKEQGVNLPTESIVEEDSKDELISFHDDFMISRRNRDLWQIGEMSIGKEFVVGHSCIPYPGVGEMQMGYNFKVTRPDEVSKPRGIGQMKIKKTFEVR